MALSSKVRVVQGAKFFAGFLKMGLGVSSEGFRGLNQTEGGILKPPGLHRNNLKNPRSRPIIKVTWSSMSGRDAQAYWTSDPVLVHQHLRMLLLERGGPRDSS